MRKPLLLALAVALTALVLYPMANAPYGALAEPVPVAVVSSVTSQGLEAIDPLLAGRPGDADRRRDQARTWLTSQLRVEFGRFGLSRAEEWLDSRPDTPFADHARMARKLETLLSARPANL